MTWDEISGGNWTIPAGRYKTGNEVTLPLSAAAVKVLAELPRITDCEFVFTTDGRRPISGFSTFKLKFDIACGVGQLEAARCETHRAFAFQFGRVSCPILPRDALGHVITGIRGVYDRHPYLDEMKNAFERLAAQIDCICGHQMIDRAAAIARILQAAGKCPSNLNPAEFWSALDRFCWRISASFNLWQSKLSACTEVINSTRSNRQ